MASDRADWKIEDAQYQAWGVVVQNHNLDSAHVANGIVQLMRLTDSSFTLSDVPLRSSSKPKSFPQRYTKAVTEALDTLYPDKTWKLQDHARAFAVTKHNLGAFSLAEHAPDETPAYKKFQDAGRAHLMARFDPPRLPDERAHGLLSRVLSPDLRVRISGADDPTTSSLAFAGYSSMHTVKTMHAATALGLLAATADGQEALRLLEGILRDDSDPHAQMVELLGLSVGGNAVPQGTRIAYAQRFPVPDGINESPFWSQATNSLGAMAKNLLSRSDGKVSKADALMSLLDLVGLFFSTLLLRWPAHREGHPERVILSTCRRVHRLTQGSAISYARRSLRMAASGLDHTAESAGLVKKKEKNVWWPSRAALNLGAHTGWMYPVHARGGARRFFSPGPRQLATLVHALLPPGEEASWREFHQLVVDHTGLCLGGVSEVEYARRVGVGAGAASAVRYAGTFNQRFLVSLGLAREESDDVVRVDGGAR